ncbi:Nucleoid occlusion protein [Alphaproteobacteria bacterium SO-S41]|nr:Nucleoid occlusion protein [Alphaproteobacteria bacterium SO-S41]
MNAIQNIRAGLQSHIDATKGSISAVERGAGVGKGVISKLLSGAKDTIDIPTAEAIAASIGKPITELLSGVVMTPAAAARQIHPDRLMASPLNPRKAQGLDAGAISDLARSLADQGQLQNLIARPLPVMTNGSGEVMAGMFEIVAGERRWRAAVHGIAKGILAPDFELNVIVRELTDEQLVELALTENIVRRDMSPLEEADGIAFLHDKARAAGTTKAFTKHLADAMGMSDRWIQKRVKLSTALVAPAREALVAGKLSLAIAQELSELLAGIQHFALPLILQGSIGRVAENLHKELATKLPKVKDAIFDMDQWDGGTWTADLYGNKVEFLGDPKRAEQLQAAALKEKRKKIEDKGGTVETTKQDWNWREAKKGETGATLFVRDGFGVKVKKNMVSTQTRSPVTSAAPGAKADPAAEAAARQAAIDAAKAREAARIDWQNRVADALRGDEVALMRATILATLIGDDVCWPNPVGIGWQISPDARAQIAEKLSLTDHNWRIGEGAASAEMDLAAAKTIAAASPKALRAAFAVAVLSRVADQADDELATSQEEAFSILSGIELPEILVTAPAPAAEAQP